MSGARNLRRAGGSSGQTGAGHGARRLALALALALAALVAPAAAVAKSGQAPGEADVLELTNDPDPSIVTDRVWTAELRVRPPELLRRSRPSVLVLNERTGERRSFAVERSGDRFTADVVFPGEGRWAYGVATGGRFVDGREYVEVTKAAARSDPAPILAVSGFLVLGALVLGVSALRH